MSVEDLWLWRTGPTRTWCKHSGPDGVEGRCALCEEETPADSLEVIDFDPRNKVVTLRSKK